MLLVSSSARPQMWIIPGGKVKPEEEPEMSAAREALEEAGVVGKLGRCLGIFENKERRHRTSVYILTVEQLLEQYDVSGRSQNQTEKLTGQLYTGDPFMARSRFGECFRQVEAEVISYSSNKIHQTWGPPFSSAL